MVDMKLPSLEQMIKWIWESLNLLIEDIVRVLEYLYGKLEDLLSELS